MRFRLTLTGAAALLLVPTVLAQDLQPGRNFPNSGNTTPFGTGRSENLDVGDIDNDGDFDVLIANGGDGAAQLNRIYINAGGAQLGSPGTFSDGTGTRLAGQTSDTSRDGEFADMVHEGADAPVQLVGAALPFGPPVTISPPSKSLISVFGLDIDNSGRHGTTSSVSWSG